MKIDKIHIENFGKLSNLIFDLSSGLNQLYKENGFGKTTFSVFIKAMFYGMPAARENHKMERKKYMPWQGGPFGGYIEYTTDNGKFRLTRFFGKTPESDEFELMNLTTNEILAKPKVEIGEQLFGVGRETFEMTAFFPQNNFVSYANNEMSANILGLDKLKFDLANVNLAIEKIKKKEAELKKRKSGKEEINNLKNQLIFLQNQLAQKQQSSTDMIFQIEGLDKKLSEKVAHFDEAKKEYQIHEEMFEEKVKIEQQLLTQRAELNNLYFEQEKLKKPDKSNTENLKGKKAINVLFVILGIILAAAPIILAAFNFLSPAIAAIASVGALAVDGILYFLSFEIIKTRQRKIKQQELNEKISSVRGLIKSQEAELERYQNITSEKDAFFAEKDEISTLNLQLEKDKLMQENNNKEIDRLIEAVENMKDDISNLEQREKEINKKLLLLAQTKEFLTKAHQNVSMRFVAPVNNAMNEIMQKFQLRDREFVVDTNFEIKQITDRGAKELDYSSQGIKDILSFCIRVYFVGEIFKNEKPMIILDDTFSNLDDENLTKAGQILLKLSEDYQVIYSYCHERCKI